MTVQEFRRADAIIAEQFAQPRQQNFQPSGFRRLRAEQSLLYGLRTRRLRLHMQGGDCGLRRVRLQTKLDQFQQCGGCTRAGWDGPRHSVLCLLHHLAPALFLRRRWPLCKGRIESDFSDLRTGLAKRTQTDQSLEPQLETLAKSKQAEMGALHQLAPKRISPSFIQTSGANLIHVALPLVCIQ
jgi:hypothetical protein